MAFMGIFQVDYLCVTGGSGMTRMSLDELPKWLADRPGYMIIRLTPLDQPLRTYSDPANNCVRQD